MPSSHPLALRATLTVADLAGTALVVPPPSRAWTVAIEAAGWPLTLHFVTLGVGLAVVNGCVRVPPDLTTRVITDLPPVPYYAAHVRGRASDPRVASLLTGLRSSRATER